jgi:large subunit ribosomal protein L29
MKKAQELREMPLEELETLVREKSEELMNMKIQLNLRQVDNPLRVREARREIAVIKTVITQKRAAEREPRGRGEERWKALKET